MMKKILIFSLVLIFAFILTACSADTKDANLNVPQTSQDSVTSFSQPNIGNDFTALTEGKTVDDFNAKSVLIIHYRRNDGDYSKWNLWIWPSLPESKEGKKYDFTGQDSFGVYAVVPFDETVESAGFIVRTDNWEKDVGVDRFAEFSTDGISEIWVLTETEKFYTANTQIDLSPKIKGVIVDKKDEINVELSEAFDTKEWSGKITAYIGDKEIKISDVYKTDPTDISVTSRITLKLADAFSIEDFSENLKVNVSGFVQEVPSIFRNVLNDKEYFYDGDDLGLTYTDKYSQFKVWSPVSGYAKVLIFNNYNDEKPSKTYNMERDEKGVWSVKVSGNLEGKFYLYEFYSYGKVRRTVDIYSKAVSVNTKMSAIADLKNTEPAEWYVRPELKNPEDSVIYEIHVKDFTIDPSSGIPEELRGKYLGLVYENSENPEGLSTGISHLKELGITHVHIMPFQDAGSLDETKFSDTYGWGYDPKIYTVPEGLYSTDPENPLTRIKEVKEMVNGFHKNGIRVVMDVVYNHTFQIGENSPFDQTVPYYYYRTNEKGDYTNGSGCGNEIATERLMMRKYIIDTLKYWVEEYKVDGYRFDLLGLFDKETVETISEELHAILPDVILYGEPWTGGGATLFGKGDQKDLNVALFNDDVRDTIRGSVFNETQKGFGLGALAKETRVKRTVVGSVYYSSSVNSWTNDPEETINYVSNHDNHTLWDKNALAIGVKPWEQEITAEQNEILKSSQKFSNAIILTSQGIPFLHGGVDFARTKEGDSNPYNKEAPNVIDWNRKTDYQDVFDYYKGLIEIRKNHHSFRLNTSDEIIQKIEFTELPRTLKKIVAFTITDTQDSWKEVFVIYNANDKNIEFTLPEGVWNIVVNGETAGETIIDTAENTLELTPFSAYVMYK